MFDQNKQQRRRVLFTADAKFAISAPAQGKPTTLKGYALIWNSLSKDRGGYKVRLKPYSAKVATSSLALFHHDSKAILGNTENGTLRFAPDETGLGVEIDLPDTTTGRDTATLVADKYIRGMSFGMLLDPEPTCDQVVEDGENILEFSDFTLDEVTVTAIPAFVDTSIEVKPDDEEDDPEVPGEMVTKHSTHAERAKLDHLGLRLLIAQADSTQR